MIRALVELSERFQSRVARSRFGVDEPFKDTRSYAQCGEDRIVALIFHSLGIRRPSYLDVGANEPVEFSNTFLFYRQGSRGVCIEANPALCDELKRVRPRDTCVNVGVGARSGSSMTLHVFERGSSGLTTFSKEQAELQVASGGLRVQRTLEIPIVSLNDVVQEHCGGPPDFMSIDIEGLEIEVLTPFDFAANGPTVICAETLQRTASGGMEKNGVLSGLIESRGYLPFADTYINTVFVRADRFPRL